MTLHRDLEPRSESHARPEMTRSGGEDECVKFHLEIFHRKPSRPRTTAADPPREKTPLVQVAVDLGT